MIKLPVLTSSSARCFEACARQYKFKYMMGYRTRVTPDYFTYGSYVHALLESWYTGLEVTCATDDLDDDEVEKINALVDAYKKHYASDYERFTVVSAEEEFRVEDIGYTLAGKLDLVVEENGERWILEHKTASALPSSEVEINRSPQIMNYLMSRPDVKGIIYNVLLKPKMKRKKDESFHDFSERVYTSILKEPEKYFLRYRILRTDDIVKLAYEYNDEKALSLEFAIKHNHWPHNRTSCFRFGRPCEFYDICQEPAARERELLESSQTLAKSEKMHPELGEENNAI